MAETDLKQLASMSLMAMMVVIAEVISIASVPWIRPNSCVLLCHSSQCLEKTYQQTHQVARPRFCLSIMALMMVVVAVVI